MQTQPILIRPEPTPNPMSVRYVVNRNWLDEGTANFPTVESVGERSPLATRLFAIEHIAGVMLGRNFVTVTSDDLGDLNAIIVATEKAIEEHDASGEPTLIGAADPQPELPGADDPVTRRIVQIIETEIRPAVAMDGGDITFGSYTDGVVKLHLRGSCSGCPSSMMTLKMGIERRLKEEMPEIVSVEAV